MIGAVFVLYLFASLALMATFGEDWIFLKASVSNVDFWTAERGVVFQAVFFSGTCFS